jgi:DNA-binding response OmpR family regulator
VWHRHPNPSITISFGTPHPRRRVLVIDDDPLFSLVASETVQQAGFTVGVASNAEEALASSEKETPDLVILNIAQRRYQAFKGRFF